MNPLRASVHAGGLLLAVGVIAWVTGQPAMFPSLGPTAYVLALDADGRSDPRRVIGGHVVGVIAGLASYRLLAGGLVVTAPPPALSTPGFRLATAGVVSVGLTTAGMLASDLRHAPACATTLIVSLGLLSSPADGALIVASVVALVATDRLLRWVDRRVGRGV